MRSWSDPPRGLRLAMLALALGLAACVSTAPEAEEPATALRGVDFTGELDASEPAVEAVVTIVNPRSQEVVLTFPDSCLALLRVYEADGDRLAPVWDQAIVSSCLAEPVELRLGPGESREIPVPPARVDAILGGSLPDARYRVTAYLRPDGRVIEIDLDEVELSS